MTEKTKSREAEKPVVAYLGPKASYTHQAALDTFNDDSYTLDPQITIEDVFSAVQTGKVYRGVVPFENSTNGSVVFTLDLFADLHNKYPGILVCGESYIPVQHCLLSHYPGDNHGSSGTPYAASSVIESPLSSGAVTPTNQEPVPQKPTARPIGDLSRIRKIYSHPQAWGQCKIFLNTYLKGIERQDVSSTSRAAELVSEDQSGTSAAISSVIAARVFGLRVLAKGIEERGDNTTRFFIIKRMGADDIVKEASKKGENDKHWKSLISFTVDHANPGALANSLSVFERYGLNLTSINTRPSGVENWNYIFFVEIKGRKIEDDEEKGDVNRALRDLDAVCRGRRWLGSWRNRLLE
ncbi:prephenate dehydratase [Periconia macrospinosa]|uniref:prephenate dehydratase n=1 Tax=Periconia macrospinosa TaxID=97972 RepID=A0A2V1DWP4_9PLEO|nr:prephenate dehydratase [Periconia macrospinosa]